jgi:hypothetical protein
MLLGFAFPCIVFSSSFCGCVLFSVCFTSVSVCATAVFYAFCCGAVLGGDVVGGGAAGFPVVVVGCGSSGCEMRWLWCLEVRRW